MIYIVGYTFSFVPPQMRSSSTGSSIQERIASARKTFGQPKTIPSSFTSFLPGNVYRISRIQQFVENKETKVKYLFTNQTDSSLDDIELIFPTTTAGDEYVAMVSGKTAELAKARNEIMAALESDRDL